jgi:hypothetical protein
MTGEPSSQSLRDLPAALLKNRWAQLFLAIFALLELYNHGAIPAFINTQKGIETRAIAENATLRQKAEAELAEWKAITETQIAKYAERKQRADARKATADARKAEAEQIIARETAGNSEVKAKAEAEALEGEAAIKEQQVIVERERANQAQRLNQAQAAEAEYKAIFTELANWIATSNAQPNVACSLFGKC